MANFTVQFRISMLIAAVLGEAVSFLFYNHHSAWGRKIGDRYLITAIVCDAVLVMFLQWIIDQYYSVHTWEDAAIMALYLTAFYASVEAPHCVYDHHSLSYFFGRALHKFCMLFVMTFALVYFKKYD